MRTDGIQDLPLGICAERCKKGVMTYFWVALGSALGGIVRYALTRWTLDLSSTFPWGTVAINIVGCFMIGFFGTFTLASGRFPVSENMRLFVMVGFCGGFTTFSSFSLQTFDLVRNGAWLRAGFNVAGSVLLCFFAVGLGHLLAHHSVARAAVAETRAEEYTG